MDVSRVVFVAEMYEQMLKRYGHEPKNCSSDIGGPLEATAHVLWMCGQLKRIALEDMDKACRWLGFIQGVLWTRGFYTIDEMREHNCG